MNKSKYGKPSIIIILIATLFISAAIAIFGLTTNKGTGANSSAEISAPEKEASSAIVDGGISDDGTISAPEVDAKATATYSGLNNWSTAVATSGNTITLPPPGGVISGTTVYTLPAGISLTLDINGISCGFAGGVKFVVNGTLTVKNSGSNGSLFANGTRTTDHIFNVMSGGTLNIESGTISGNASSRCVLVNAGGTFNMKGGTIQDGTNGYGGGVYNAGTFNMSSGTIKGCTAEHGGGVYQQAGTFTMSGGTIENCTQNTPGWKGGGVAICGGTFTMSGSSKIQNNTGTYGGGVFVDGGATFNMNGGEIFTNTAREKGGGVYVDSDSKFNKTGGYIGHESTAGSGNKAAAGGGVATWNATFTCSSGEIDLNTATGDGGGVWIGGTSEFTFSGGYIDGNKSGGAGGGVRVDGTSAKFTLSGGNVGYGNYRNTAVTGGGVCSGGIFEMSSGKIRNNDSTATSSYGGGGVRITGGTFNVTGGEISGNTTKANGGGVYVGSGTISLSGTLINANTADKDGGGLFLSGGTFTIGDNTEVYSNTATNGSGGGIYSNSISFTINKSTTKIRSNKASVTGGGIALYNNPTLTMSAGEITSNTVTGTTYGRGGGIYTQNSGKITMSGGKIDGNTTTKVGGGVCLYAGTFTMTGGEISNNKATSTTDGEGGGIYGTNTPTISVSGTSANKALIHGNTAGLNGGGIRMVSGTLSVGAYTEIYSNTATTSGGGIYTSVALTINQATTKIYSNTGTVSGGGIYSTGSSTLTVSAGYIYSNTASYGGGVYMYNGTFKPSGSLYIGRDSATSTDKGNTASYGGGVYLEGSATLTNSGGHIDCNKANIDGGGVYSKGTFSMSSGTISNNTATGNGGGVFLNGSNKTFTFSGGTIGENTATNGHGGGVCIQGGNTLTMNNANAIISGNKAQNSSDGMGGGVINYGTFNFSAGHIRSNKARVGGGLFIVSGCMVVLNGGTIGGATSYGNEASQYGGGVYCQPTWTPVSGTISYNKVTGTASDTTPYGGAGVYVSNGTFTVNTANLAINNNTTSSGYGGGVHVAGGEFKMTAGNIRNNSASRGGGVYVSGAAKFTMSGGTIGGISGTTNYGNTGDGGGVYLKTTGACSLSGGTISYNSNYGNGGGVYIASGTTLNHTNGTISNNTGYNYGGGVYNAGTYNQNGANANVYSNSTTIYGGGVYNAGTYTLTNGNVGGKSGATDYGNYSNFGGGIYNAGTFNFNGGNIANNNASRRIAEEAYPLGGGVYSYGTFTMTGGTISSNSVSASVSGVATGGGGVYIGGGTFTLSGGNIRSNTSPQNGGGVYVSSGTFNMTGGTIGGSGYANTATANGGGVFISTTTAVAFSGGTISYNTAGYGGGVYLDAGATLNMSSTSTTSPTVAYNSATTQGGGIRLNGSNSSKACTLNLSGGSIYKNSATGNGGGIGAVGTNAVINMTGGTIGGTANTYANSAASGGGVYSTGTFTMSDGIIAYNTASDMGGGVYIASGTFTMKNTAEIHHNTATSSGAGVCIASGATFNLQGGEIHHNTATNGVGGGIHAFMSTVTITGGKIHDNTAGNMGGGISAYGSATITLKAGEIYNNSATNHGGGIRASLYTVNGVNHLPTVKIEGGSIYSNTAGNEGGGVFVENGTLTMSGGTIGGSTEHANHANSGGGVFVTNATLTITGGTVSYNTATGAGGLYIGGGTTTISNAEIIGNSAGYGGGLYISGGTTTIGSTDITENRGFQGGGAYVNSGTLAISSNAAIGKNSSSGAGGGVYVFGGTLVVSNGIIAENTAAFPYGAGVYLDGGKLMLGGRAIIIGNTYNGTENNVFAGSANSIIFDSKLTEDAHIGVTSIQARLVLTSGYTTIGHVEADIEKNFSSDNRAKFKYENNEIVVEYNVADVWNATVQASLDNNTQERFVLYSNWTPDSNGSFGEGVGFHGAGNILVPENSNVLLDLNNFNIDRNGTSGSAMRVEGTLVIDSPNGGSIKGGNAENGGAIYVYGGHLTLSSGTISDNVASYGGAIYVDGSGEFTMDGGEILRNHAENGGAVYVKEGTFTLNKGTIGGSAANKNEATSYGGAIYVAGGGIATVDGGLVSYNEALSGGVVYVNGGKLNVNGGTIIKNKATENGGAIYVDSGIVNIDGGLISENTAEDGGGMYVAGGNVTFSDGDIEFNTATLGGGMYIAGGTVTVDGGDIVGGTATENGAGVYITGGSLVMSDGVIAGNTATENGGGVYVTGTAAQFTLSGGIVTQNKAKAGLGVYVNGGTATVTGEGKIYDNKRTDSVSVNGAGVYLETGTLNVTGGKITENKAQNGAGVYMSGGEFKLSGGEISGNTESRYGGGVYVNGGTFTMSGGEIKQNTASSGGGIYNKGTATLTGGKIDANIASGGGAITNEGTLNISGTVEISGNRADGGGGVLISGSSAQTTISGGKIINNTGHEAGGGIAVVSGTLTMTDGLIDGNNAGNQSGGGGVYIVNDSAFTLSGGTISNNTTTGYGGGVFLDGTATITIAGGEISGNTAGWNGGGVCVYGGTFEMTDGVISANSAQKGAGVYVYNNKTFDMTGGEISGNTATGATTTYGGGVFVATGAEFNVSEESEIISNTATLGGGVYVEGTLNLTAGAISENSAASGGGVYVNGGSVEMTGGEITKNSATNANVGFGGGGVFVLSGTMTVSGTSKINENSAARYGGGIRIDGTSDSATVEISHGLLNNNTATYGGGAYVAGNFATLTLSDAVIVSENTATTAGGGIAVASGAKLNVEGNALITDNTATLNGGGVYVADAGSKLNVSDKGAITYNTANYGGGVYATSGSAFTVEGGSLSYNEATANGGAVYVSGATFTLNDGEVLGNTATANGGGVYVAAGATSAFVMNGGIIGREPVDTDVTDVANVATLGGGVYIAGGSVTLTSGEIKANEATENGGGVYFNAGTLSIKGNPVIEGNVFQSTDSNLYLYNGKTVNVTGKLTDGAHIGVTGTGQVTVGYTTNGNGEDEKDYFSGDVAGSVVVINVGEIFLQISLEDAWNAAVQASLDKGGKEVTFVLAETWRATDGAFGEGVGFTDDGALYLPAGAYIALNLNGYTINRNLDTATLEGSVFYIDGKLKISGTTGYITGGNSENGGGVSVNDGGYLELAVGNIQNNTATENGGGVYVASGATFKMTGGTVRGNSAKYGGAVYVENGGTFEMTGGVIGGTGYANNATTGGAICNYGDATLTGGKITSNTSSSGGTISNGGTLNISGTVEISSNYANGGGGIIAFGSSQTNISGGKIINNTGNECGGGIIFTGGTLTMTDGLIDGNNAGFDGGGGVIMPNGNGTFTMSGGTISNNTTTAPGGGVCAPSGKFIMNGGVIKNNTASIGGGVYIHGTFEMTGGVISGNSAQTGAGVYAYGASFSVSGGEISSNTITDSGSSKNGGGVYLTNDAEMTMSGGKISGNTGSYIYGGGVYVDSGSFTMSGGEISGNIGASQGAGIYNKGTATLTGGKIVSNRTSTGGGGGGVLNMGGTLNVSGTVEISGNYGDGGGVLTTGTSAQATISGGKILNNTCNEAGGGVIVGNGTLTMTGGLIDGNTGGWGGGGGVLVTSAFTMSGGTISGNTSTDNGAGVYVAVGTFTMTGGVITNNTESNTSSTYRGMGGGVYVNSNAKFKMTGGTITANTAGRSGGGVHVTNNGTFEIEGSPMIYGNTVNGAENNVYLVANKTMAVTGMLSVNGTIAYVGVTMESPSGKKFTTGFTTNNTEYNPSLLPATVFFSDNTAYMVGLEDGEAALVTNDYSQSSLVWQLSKDDGAHWISVDVPTFSLKYKEGETYSVRALNSAGEEVAFTWATDVDGNDIDASDFSGIGSYKFVVNSNAYLNPALTIEILPATLYWQYSTDEGATWFDLTVDTMVYTSAEYKVRAIIYDTDSEDGYEVIQLFTETMKNVGNYEYTVTDGAYYENPTLNFTITTRYITVEWNFGDALGNLTNGYYWEYDGLTHSPIAVLNGVSNELAGVDLSYNYDWSGGYVYSSAQSFVGTYTLTVGLTQADPNVVLSNTTVEYKINGVTLTLTWVDENGNEGDEFTFEYDSEKHGVDFILNGVVTGDTVGAYITYASRSGKILSEAPSAVGYYTATVKLPVDCYNYVFDRTYICQIVITQKAVAVQWQPNTDGSYEWSFNGLGKGPVASIINPYTGEELNEPYKIEYAPVASNGNIGQYSTTQPVNAGNYIVRLTLNNPDANYVLDEDTTTQLFSIKKLDVTVTWKGATYDADKDVYFWQYDGNEHDLEAEISLVGLAVNKDGVIISSLDIERTDSRTKLVSVGSATATVVLLNNAFNANFNITNSTSQVYEVRKAVISEVEWTDMLNQKFASDETPEYDFGSVKGENGPAFVATALNGTVTLAVTYNKSYEGDWVVDETIGYTAYAKLSAADAANYEFAEGAEYAIITFFINSVGGYKTDIDVTWVVFINEHEYVVLEQYLNEGGFVYNGTVQHPTPIYLKDNGIDYEVLDLQQSSIGADAGMYTARLKPSSVYNIKEADFTCDYEIKKLDIVVSWQDGQYDSNTTFTYTYNGGEQAPYAYVSGNYDFEIAITVNGKTNAGTYPATAVVSNNFNITSGKTQVYTIEKKGLDTGLIVWDYVGAGASGSAEEGWYWIYDGKEHAPAVKIPAANWGGEFDIELVVTGKTSEIGTHTAYAVLNSSIAAHNNFYLTGTAETTFEIVQVKAGKVYWEDASGHTYEDGKGGNTGLVFTYNGNTEGQKPKAYYLDENGKKVYLDVTVIGGKAVDAGTYTAYVSSELDFASALPACTFTINPMEIRVDWDDETVLTFNGTEQHPEVTLSDGASHYELEEGTDYVVTGFTKAGKYTAEIKFINTNYTCAADDKTFEFEIEKIALPEIDGEDYTEGFEWDTTGYDEDSETYVWTYDGIDHNPVLNVTYTIDGEEVVFEIGYLGVTSAVGKHKVTAYVKSAMLNGEDVTENFTIEAEMEYEIKSVSVSIDWDWGDALTGTDEEGNEYRYWSYDGTKHSPKAYLKDAEGNRIKDAEGNDIELDVYGGEINARDDAAYTLTAVVPSEYHFTGDNTQKYFIKKATIEVVWDFGDNAEYDEETGVYSWTYGGEVEPKAYIKVTSTDEEGNVTVTKGAELTVTGFETDAGTHALTVMQSDGNYKFASDGEATQTYVIKPQKVYVLWYGKGGIKNEDTTNFEWTYGGENTAPTAYLAYKNEEGELQLILVDALDNRGRPVKVPVPVEVSGASNEIGTHTAQAVDTFVNYEFADDETTTHSFKIAAKDLAANKFKWTAEGAKVSEDGLTFTYEYSGKNNLPVPSSNVEDLAFNVKIEKVNEDGNTEVVLAITEVGKYKVTATSQNGNYTVPDGKDVITVIVTKKTVKAEWDKSKLVYNGDDQMPKAYYTDVDGNRIELEVSVTGDSADAGTNYTATATLDSNNYVLDTNTTETTFKIEQKEIKVEWTWTDVDYTGKKEHAPVPEIRLTAAEKDGITKIVYEITDKDGNVVAGDGEKVKDAGEYKMKVTLEGPAAGNYKLDVAEYTFNIYKLVLKVTAKDKETVYGNSLALTIDDVTFEGFIEGEAEDITEELKGFIEQWLICHYTSTSLPENSPYTIYVDSTWLNDYLGNYTVTGVNGKLTVKPAEGKLIWVADKYDEEGTPVFTYNGEANLPKAFYYDARGEKVNLNVKLATLGEDGEYVVSDGEAKTVAEYYAVIVDDEGNVIKKHGSYTFENFGAKFAIEKREIVINLSELKFTYGDLTEEHLADHLGFGIGWNYGETEPVAGDVLGVTLKINGSFDDGGYLKFVDGGYEVTVKHDEAYDGNYTFVVEGEQKLIVDKADITVKDYDGIYASEEEVYTVYDDNGILKGTEGYISNFVTKTKDFLNIAGYQDADVEIKFSECFNFGDEIPDINGYRFMGDPVEKVFEEGKYVYLFKIEIPNHKTLYGQLIVDVKFDDYYLSLEIVKDKLTEEYGYEIPETLASWLIENGYAKYDEEDNAAVSKETFLSWVTATVYDENGEEVTGKLDVGTYKVVFGLSEEADDRYSIYKATSRTVAIEITKRVINIDWGNEDNLNYVYDGETHMPVITVAGLTDENGNPVTLNVGENEIIVNGEIVKVLVTVDGEFTEVGAYSVLVTVDSENFEIGEEAALRSVFINEPAAPPVEVPVPAEGAGVEDWKLWLIIAAAIVLAGIIIAIVVAAAKRRKVGDDDGFYDPVDESDL